MQVNFNGNAGNKRNVKGMTTGTFGDMVKMRKKMLPEIQDSLQEALADYDGQSLTLIISKEDENGLPVGHHVLIAGVSRMETQIDMTKALSKASDTSLELIMEGAGNDPKAMLAVAKAMVEVMEREKNREK